MRWMDFPLLFASLFIVVIDNCSPYAVTMTTTTDHHYDHHDYHHHDRIQRCCTIMGRKETDEMSSAQIMYPLMQCADVFFLKVRSNSSKTPATIFCK